MNKYHKIQTVYKRDPANNHKTLLEGQWTRDEFRYLASNRWIFTEKVDGTNIRVQWDADNGGVGFAGKSDKAQIPPFLLESLNAMFDTRMGQVFDCPACLYGEGYGARIQKGGGNYRSEASFVLFDVKVGDWWLKRDDVDDIAAKLNLTVVPVVGLGSLFEMVEMAREGFVSTWGDFPAEGIVARPEVELQDRNGRRIITKIKHKDFAREGKQ